ncbi:hypothetical protein BDZ89DRAFT_1158351 [Hymenopellis radicata]|nr:hypothetical protein BDZ89DRAFT_1158351 [Hymenopellis radicata]
MTGAIPTVTTTRLQLEHILLPTASCLYRQPSYSHLSLRISLFKPPTTFKVCCSCSSTDPITVCRRSCLNDHAVDLDLDFDIVFNLGIFAFVVGARMIVMSSTFIDNCTVVCDLVFVVVSNMAFNNIVNLNAPIFILSSVEDHCLVLDSTIDEPTSST